MGGYFGKPLLAGRRLCYGNANHRHLLGHEYDHHEVCHPTDTGQDRCGMNNWLQSWSAHRRPMPNAGGPQLLVVGIIIFLILLIGVGNA
jgi:hypothetical protein